jgi:hypothetical protein
MRSVLLCAALAASPAFADQVFDAGAGDYIRLTDQPCKAQLEPAWQRLHPRAAVALINGKPLKACWVSVEGIAAIRYEDGASVGIPLSVFKPVRDV